MQLVANLSMMFVEFPLIERLDAARDAGFDIVEIQFPYDADLDALEQARRQSGAELCLINLPAGDLAAGDVGLTCLAGRQPEFRDAVEQSLVYARRLDVKLINSLSGRPPLGEQAEATKTLIDNLRFAADRFAEIGATVLVEPVNPNDVPGFMFNRLEPALEAIAAVDRDNVQLLFDFYHMAQTEPSLSDAIRQSASVIGHVQFADTPGRREPGTGTIDFTAALTTLKAVGYDGYLSAEYRPAGATLDSLGWMTEFGDIVS